MAATKPRANRNIEVAITEENRQRAIRSNSGGCLIADALKSQGFKRVEVDMAMIRLTDPDAGLRFYYMTPPDAQNLLVCFDNGWPLAIDRIRLRKPVKVLPIREGGYFKSAAARATRLAELERKETAGTLNRTERIALANMRRTPAPRPRNPGPATIDKDGIVVGGRPPLRPPANPNLLRGVNRIYGAKTADPGMAFREAVKEAVAIELGARGSEPRA